jgi:hypothetical protein
VVDFFLIVCVVISRLIAANRKAILPESTDLAANISSVKHEQLFKILAVDGFFLADMILAEIFADGMPDSSILEGSRSTPSLWAMIALPGGCSSSMTDCMSVDSDTSSSSGFFTPRLTVRLPCGSASISKTLLPVFARPTPRLTVVVVLPTPPFWFVIAITLQFSMCFPPFLEFTTH